jgi:HSP20 family protein
MLIQTDPFRDLDTLFSRFAGRQTNTAGTAGVMPMDAFRRGSDVWVHIDLPGVKADSLDITIERNLLTISAERNWQRQDGDQPYFAERYRGNFRRQIQLGDGLDLQNLEADLHDGVLTVRIPVAEQAKPRKVAGRRTPRRPRRTPSKQPRPTQPELLRATRQSSRW